MRASLQTKIPLVDAFKSVLNDTFRQKITAWRPAAGPSVQSSRRTGPGPAGTYQGHVDQKTGRWVQPEPPST